MDHTDVESLVEKSLAGLPAAGIAVSVSSAPDTAARCRGQIAGEPVTPATPMYAASVTKQIVGYLTAVAVEDARLAYDARIVDIRPGLPSWLGEVRIRHLLHHTSGLPEVTKSASGQATHNGAVLDRLRASAPDTITPGVRFAYSNTGYIVLAEAVAVTYATPLDQLARAEIFEPLGMADSRLGGRPASIPGFPDPPGTVGDGGLWTTLNDLTVWLSALNQRRPGSAAAARLDSPGALDDGASLDYGWGVRVTQTATGPLVTHGGSWPGWVSKTVRYPERDIAVAVMSHGSDDQTISQLGITLAERTAAA